jgi:hypothetical protein
MSPSPSESKKKAPDAAEIQAGPSPVTAPPEPRATPPTRFPRLRALGERELAGMAPAARASYLAEKAHQDAWGHLPPQISVHLRGVELPPLAVEHHARDAKTDPVHFAATKAYYRWALGQEMSREKYAAAVAHVLSEPHGL